MTGNLVFRKCIKPRFSDYIESTSNFVTSDGGLSWLIL